MKENEIFAKRLRGARIKSKMSMEELSHKIGGLVSKQSISRYEAAIMMPSSTVLLAFADALGVEPDYLVRPYTFDMGSVNISFRKQYKVGAKDVAALKVNIQDEIERYLEIEDILGVRVEVKRPEVASRLSTREDMIQCAKDTRKIWNLGGDAISNIQDTLETNGVKVIFTPGPEGFDGVSGIVNDSHYIIVLNSNISMVERRRFTALHELGHLLFNSNIDPELSEHDKEKLCHDFASEMLLPEDALKFMYSPGSKLNLKSLIYLQETYGISLDAIFHKFHDMGIMGDGKYRDYYRAKNSDAKFKSIMEQSRYTETYSSRFESMVYNALSNRLIAIPKAASLLACSEEEVSESFTKL